MALIFRCRALAMTGNLFELEDLGARVLKGIALPVRALATLRVSYHPGADFNSRASKTGSVFPSSIRDVRC